MLNCSQRSHELYSETMRLNILENHLSLIVNFEQYCNMYQCIHCGTETVIITVTPKLVKPQFVIFFQRIFIKTHPQYLKNLKKSVFVSVQTKDFSLILLVVISKPISLIYLPGNGPKLSFEVRHVPLSVGIATNVLNFENGVCFVTNDDENDLVQKMLKYLEDASNAVHDFTKRKFDCVFQLLELSKNVRKENLTYEFKAYCRDLIVIGFNSASYDLNLINQH